MSQTNDKSHFSSQAPGDPVFGDQIVRALVRSTPSLRPKQTGPLKKEDRLGDVDALKHDLNNLAESFRWEVWVDAELVVPRPKILPAFKKLSKTATAMSEQLDGLGGILRWKITEQYGTKKEELARFRKDIEAHHRLTKWIQKAKEHLEIPKGRAPRDNLLGWLCERMAGIYEKHSGKQFTHLRMTGSDAPRGAFATDGAHFAANAIMDILSENEPTAAELDTAFANIVKNKKIHSD